MSELTEQQYEILLARIDILMDAETEEDVKELSNIADVVVEYEEKHYPLPSPLPMDVIQHYIEQRGLTADDIVKVLDAHLAKLKEDKT